MDVQADPGSYVAGCPWFSLEERGVRCVGLIAHRREMHPPSRPTDDSPARHLSTSCLHHVLRVIAGSGQSAIMELGAEREDADAKNDVVFFMNLCRSVSGLRIHPTEGALDIVLEQGADSTLVQIHPRPLLATATLEASEDDIGGSGYDGNPLRRPRQGQVETPLPAHWQRGGGDIGGSAQPQRAGGIAGGSDDTYLISFRHMSVPLSLPCPVAPHDSIFVACIRGRADLEVPDEVAGAPASAARAPHLHEVPPPRARRRRAGRSGLGRSWRDTRLEPPSTPGPSTRRSSCAPPRPDALFGAACRRISTTARTRTGGARARILPQTTPAHVACAHNAKCAGLEYCQSLAVYLFLDLTFASQQFPMQCQKPASSCHQPKASGPSRREEPRYKIVLLGDAGVEKVRPPLSMGARQTAPRERVDHRRQLRRGRT